MQIDDIRKKLREREKQLMGRLGKIEADLGSPRPKDSEDRALQAENDEVLERLDRSERAELDAIRAALARIAAGSYARCTACGGEIGMGRLAALPFTDVCVDCAR